MKKSIIFGLFTSMLFCFHACKISTTPKQNVKIVSEQEVTEILTTLASDEMDGRAIFTEGIEKAANFIAKEFQDAGLKPMYESNYRQTFYMKRTTPVHFEVHLDGKKVQEEHAIFISALPGLVWNDQANVEMLEIKAGENFAQKYRDYLTRGKDAIVIVNPSFTSLFKNYKNMMMRGKMDFADQNQNASTVVFVLGNQLPKSYRVSFNNKIEKLPLFNMVAIIPGKTKANEYVIFSGHYDHLGRNSRPIGTDSIANGADDDASGVSAMLSLAKYFQKRNDNARTLVFVAFTAEESGMYGSKYFSEKLNPEEIMAMVNIEMIGKDSKFGPNSLYVTGFNHSNLARLMQQNLKGSPFTLHPDPYPTQNLFYRSDNATLASLGVPAHTFSTVQIEKDEFYHTVKDEVETLNIKNIISSIEAIAIGVEKIVSGEVTPSRVPKLKD